MCDFDEYLGKAVIMFSGSDGIYNLTKLVAEQYVKRGMTVLKLAYWNKPGLPDGFEKVPVENIGGPVLPLYPEYDVMWPSELSAEQIKALNGLYFYPKPVQERALLLA